MAFLSACLFAAFCESVSYLELRLKSQPEIAYVAQVTHVSGHSSSSPNRCDFLKSASTSYCEESLWTTASVLLLLLL